MLIFCFVLLFYSVLFSQPEIPQLKNWATDFTKTLSSSELQQLNLRLKTYEDTTSNQLVSLMIPTLDDYPLEEYSHQVAENNKIGTKEKSNGVLFLVVKNDRKMRIEVGYGLEGVLPDALANSIIRNEIVPHFKQDEYYAGINSGINAIIAAIGGEYNSDFKEKSDGIGFTLFVIIFITVIIVLSFIPKSGKYGGRSGGYIYHGGSWGNGGSSGGSFGGFSGGGGSFGGGGSSGSW